MGRKYCGKMRNCSLRAISPFPTDLCSRHIKTRACLGKGEMQFKMSFALCFSLDQSKILSSGNGLNTIPLISYFIFNEKKITDFLQMQRNDKFCEQTCIFCSICWKQDGQQMAM